MFAVELSVLSAAVAMQTDAMYSDAQDAFYCSEWDNFTQETICLTLSEVFYTNQLLRACKHIQLWHVHAYFVHMHETP